MSENAAWRLITQAAEGEMKFRVFIVVAVLTLAGAVFQAADTGRKHINLPKPAGFANLPFSDAVLAGNTLYIAGHLGLDPKSGQPPATAEEEAKLALDATQQTLQAAGMSMDDLVSVEVHCSDVSNYEAFNKVYTGYFHGEFPARAFLGAGKLLRGARFEVLGTAVKRTQ
jgi:2-iminobutanoate/2-iminopropanoate deaminase